jgi:DNA-directed RNA polymerase specialized sigma24 family protein
MSPDPTTPVPDSVAAGREPGSVSQLLSPLREGDEEAVRKLWDRFFRRLVALARSRLGPNLRQPVDPEDIALQAFHQFCVLMARPDADERVPEMANRDNIWRVLARITAWEAMDYAQPPNRPLVDGGIDLDQMTARQVAQNQSECDEFNEEVARLLNELRGRDEAQTERLRRLALLKLEGKTNEEAARELGCGVSLVELLLRAIRKLWEQHDPRPLQARRK